MATQRLGIIMHGITGRMGYNQHLVRSIVAIRDQGGVALPSGDRVMPDPILVGRNYEKVAALAARHGIKRVASSVNEALGNLDDTVFFDAGSTQMRVSLLGQAIAAGKHVYCEKPVSETLQEALDVAALAKQHGVKSGVVQDKLYLPGLRKIAMLRESGFFGRILSVRGEFGYWVFEGDWQAAQRPSWNYRKEDGGGIILDMVPHWRYVLDNLFGEVESVSCLGANHIPERVDEQGSRYQADADDAAYATFRLAGGIIAHINSSWAVRVKRDDLVTFQVDGTHGSAVAGLTRCYTQHRVNTPRPVWNPDQPQTMRFQEQWDEVPDNASYENGFKLQWEEFIRHVVSGTTWKFDLLEGAKGVQLAELATESWRERRWVDVPALTLSGIRRAVA
ncbi:MAG TPA: Gfo/Idh/MocA family oxidoreductase [Acidisoma sp.]|uniref:Gfo/Idh/MocA family protein n=1 Tax=Acidisoma sp. TaxID=1872115 RepID=UPI002B7BE8BD|nr:Gfo/Idh/MocA family oxidoreductase [Acidisoma sp.]HTI00802.1 Gfo/Idh/MocA family oxidoreductase [Acidisoma sp.]